MIVLVIFQVENTRCKHAEVQVQRCKGAGAEEVQRCRDAEVQRCVIDKEERMQMRCLPRTTSHHAPYLLIMLTVHANYALPL